MLRGGVVVGGGWEGEEEEKEHRPAAETFFLPSSYVRLYFKQC